MQKRSLKFSNLFTNIAFSPLILISNNSELAAKYLPNEVENSITNLEIKKVSKDLNQGFDFKDIKLDDVIMNSEKYNKVYVFTKDDWPVKKIKSDIISLKPSKPVNIIAVSKTFDLGHIKPLIDYGHLHFLFY